mmetsp:Transcript_12143/g.13900  ORF Transcript_12143/g.13900 Transcript_12143/m.13900 type:complete len:157 (+) Transcript_12143:112-582(+)
MRYYNAASEKVTFFILLLGLTIITSIPTCSCSTAMAAAKPSQVLPPRSSSLSLFSIRGGATKKQNKNNKKNRTQITPIEKKKIGPILRIYAEAVAGMVLILFAEGYDSTPLIIAGTLCMGLVLVEIELLCRFLGDNAIKVFGASVGMLALLLLLQL